ncbi:MAG: xylene monooxygenase electron transfer component [Parcubacteria group bacterium Athens0714_26]|nr:MAG: xylene monooxygenase electron transfer component [Parcubacteria group bacterium Athens1014_26]TSD02152.1 MAG: xylene monooxygenase electron transfer component [Parcubacteria group bacterium Athens0714_26]
MELPNKENNIFKLKNKIKEAADVVTLKFYPLSGKSLIFKPGQFVIIYLLGRDASAQGKAYTITSLLEEEFLSISVKRLGDFSSALCSLKTGESVKITGPFGNFYPADTMNDIVFLAGGIGITPFYDVIKSFTGKDAANKKITLFYSNRTKADIVFLKELINLDKKLPRLKIIFILTRDKNNFADEFERVNVKMIKKYLKNLNSKHYFICGPIQFVNDLWQSLKKAGVEESRIKTEAFY